MNENGLPHLEIILANLPGWVNTEKNFYASSFKLI